MKCKKCGAELKGSWMFCPDCGERLEDESDLFNIPSVDDIMAESRKEPESHVVTMDSLTQTSQDETIKNDTVNDTFEETSGEAVMDPIPDDIPEAPQLDSLPETETLEDEEDELDDEEDEDDEYFEAPKAAPRILRPETPKQEVPHKSPVIQPERHILPESLPEEKDTYLTLRSQAVGIILFLFGLCFLFAGLIPLWLSGGATHLTALFVIGSLCEVSAIVVMAFSIPVAQSESMSYKRNVWVIIFGFLFLVFADAFAANYTGEKEKSHTTYVSEYKLEYYYSDVGSIEKEDAWVEDDCLVVENDFDYLVFMTLLDVKAHKYESTFQYLNFRAWGYGENVRYIIFDPLEYGDFKVKWGNDYGYFSNMTVSYIVWDSYGELEWTDIYSYSLSHDFVTTTTTTAAPETTTTGNLYFNLLDSSDPYVYDGLMNYYDPYLVSMIIEKNMYLEGNTLWTTNDFDYLVGLDVEDAKEGKCQAALSYLNDCAFNGGGVFYYIFDFSEYAVLEILEDETLSMYPMDTSYVFKKAGNGEITVMPVSQFTIEMGLE